MSKQPVWKLVANLGDVNPLDYGGLFVYIDETGVYPPEAELVQEPCDDDESGTYTVHRFILEDCTYIDGILSDNRFHPELSAWFADDLESVAGFVGQSVAELVAQFTSSDPCERANAWRAIGDYHGWGNLDEYPNTYTREEIEKRYPQFA